MTVNNCGATNREGEPCSLPAGWGTDHVGEGRCRIHGGSAGAPTGRDNGAFEHGLFSDHLDEEDRNTIDALEEMDMEEKLADVINWRLARLRRAARELNSDEGETFWDAFKQLVRKTGEPEAAELRELAKMLDRGNRAMQDEVEFVRKAIRDYKKITEGEEHQVETDWRSMLADAQED